MNKSSDVHSLTVLYHFYNASAQLDMQSTVLASYDRFRLSLRPSVCHMLVSCQNDSS